MNGLVLSANALVDLLWSRRFAAAINSFVAVLLFGTAILLVVMFGYHVVVDMRARKRERLRKKIMEAVGRVAAASASGKNVRAAITDAESLFNRRGIAVLTKAFDAMNDDGRDALRKLLLQVGGADYISSQLDTNNEDYQVELVRMVGDLDLVGLDSRLAALLYSNRDHIELQYQGFLALSKLGSQEWLVKICTDKGYVQTLSFRSLQQILKVYTGDAEELYSRLLHSSDHYVVRVCLKRIGSDGLVRLAEHVTPWLESSDYNLVIDAIRALGQLGYQPAAQRIASFLHHERWEVRAVAVTALAAIDRDDCQPQLVAALQDGEWQVRYNAGLALRSSPNKEAIRQQVLASGDKFALDMLEYMTQSDEIWRRAE